jgi:hypothetical protein
MRGQRGQKGRKKTVPHALTEAQVEEYSRDVEPPRVMTSAIDRMLHIEAWRIYKEQKRLRTIENRHERRDAEEQLEIGKASLTITMMEYNLPRREWDDGLWIERESYAEDRQETVSGTVRIARK